MTFCKINFFKTFFQKNYQTVCVQIRTDVLLVLIWGQTVCKGYQRMTKSPLARKVLKIFALLISDITCCNLQDGLLSQGYSDMINRLHAQIPKVTNDGKRLQMVVCSATLHSFDVKKMAVSILVSLFSFGII